MRSGLEGFSRLFFSYPQLLAITSALVIEEISLHVLVLSLALAFCCLLLCARLMLGCFFVFNPSWSSLLCLLWAAFCPLEFSTPDHLVISAHCWTQERLFCSICPSLRQCKLFKSLDYWKQTDKSRKSHCFWDICRTADPASATSQWDGKNK